MKQKLNITPFITALLIVGIGISVYQFGWIMTLNHINIDMVSGMIADLLMKGYLITQFPV